MIPGAKEIGGKASEANNMLGSRAQTELGVLDPEGVLGGGAPYEKLFGLQRPLDSLKINSNFINCGYEARQKSLELYGI